MEECTEKKKFIFDELEYHDKEVAPLFSAGGGRSSSSSTLRRAVRTTRE